MSFISLKNEAFWSFCRCLCIQHPCAYNIRVWFLFWWHGLVRWLAEYCLRLGWTHWRLLFQRFIGKNVESLWFWESLSPLGRNYCKNNLFLPLTKDDDSYSYMYNLGNFYNFDYSFLFDNNTDYDSIIPQWDYRVIFKVFDSEKLVFRIGKFGLI